MHSVGAGDDNVVLYVVICQEGLQVLPPLERKERRWGKGRRYEETNLISYSNSTVYVFIKVCVHILQI